MKDFDISKLLKDPSKIELDPTSPLTWMLAATALLVLIVLATILFFLIRGIRGSLEARGQRKAIARAEARNLARRNEPSLEPLLEQKLNRTPLADPDEAKAWPLEPFGRELVSEPADQPEPARG